MGYWAAWREAPVAIFEITALYTLSALSFAACGALVLADGKWVLAGWPDNWAEYFNAIMSITGIGILSLGLNQPRAAGRYQLELGPTFWRDR
ncbi:MAG: hypothetical protein WBA88_26300 [Pseudaminobacter sp.]